MYRARVERDSVSPGGSRLTTVVVEFPRSVLAEVVTHRLCSDSWNDGVSLCERTTTKDMSKNSGSSRAIPFARMVAKVDADPYMPQWTVNQKGMQGEAADPQAAEKADVFWKAARNQMVWHAKSLHEMGIHKQDANRLLEPWAWIVQVITATDRGWGNFFSLRCHKDAHPAFQRIARMIYLARRQSVPVPLKPGQWHLPFVPLSDQMSLNWRADLGPDEPVPELLKFSAARCGWTSYENHEKDGSPAAMLGTWERLVGGVPKHASPMEHQGTPLGKHFQEAYPALRSNLDGWLQLRKLLPQECLPEFTPSDAEVAGWGIDESSLWPVEVQQ
jgi:thymidylate synthase ThyX